MFGSDYMDTNEREKIMEMEKTVRETIRLNKQFAPNTIRVNNDEYLRGYLDGRLNAILIIERDLLGMQIDFGKEP